MLVAVTGWGQEEDRRHSAEGASTFDRHLAKPPESIELENILARVKRYGLAIAAPSPRWLPTVNSFGSDFAIPIERNWATCY